MNIFEYIDKKRNEYEILRDENQLQLKTNNNRIKKITAQMEHMTEEEENPSQFFLPENTGNYKEEIKKLQSRIDALQSENQILSEKMELCENELYILDTLELPNFAPKENNMAWEPMRVPEKELEKNVSRETIQDPEEPHENEIEELIQNVSRETNLEEQKVMDKKQIKEKICFCRKFSELDPRRCSLLLDEIIEELSS